MTAYSPAPGAPLQELTQPTSLTLPSGRLNPDAVGWARQPIVDTSGIARGRGRNKRWEYWNVTTPTHILALTVSSIDYAAVHEVWVLDRAAERSWGKTATVIAARGAELPAGVESGRARARAKDLEIDIDPSTGSGPEAGSAPGAGTRLRARTPDVAFDVFAELPQGHERLAVVVPWSSTRFQYTVKDVARPASGSVTIEGVTYDVPAGGSWAVLDHGRGRWPYDVRRNWGAGSGRSAGHVIGIQVGGRWTEGTGSTENAVYVDGRLHKIHEELTWQYDLAGWRKPWRVSGGGLEASFKPFYDKTSRLNLGVVSARTDQCFGHWSGTFAVPGGQSLAFAGILGWAEEVHNRW
ncbi:DUF2804 domain-containing protein [Microbacterium sp. CPCC 204701]|uniref:DUF2804 domain-containing protein n=1 Tax=Microbacterium sp. CPCC 204701 TaxID=2493084 RepID=UPI000FDC870A|nr:DUF2804 domain-containing protein [Microbacterium sp. CPCC 204701]